MDGRARQESRRGVRECSVLVIDDEEKVCWALSRVLSRLGCHARQGVGGPEGLALIAQETPDIILLDLKMPRRNGPQVLAE